MPLTNAQHDAIMRIYDGIRTHNRHIQEQRYNEIVSLIPEYQNIENEIISVSMQAAKARINGNSQDYTSLLKSLNDQKANLLISAGKPADYLDPVYTCTQCHDTGYINSRKCSCFNKKAIDLVYHDSNLKNITDNENFAAMIAPPGTPGAATIVIPSIKINPANRGKSNGIPCIIINASAQATIFRVLPDR